MAIFDNIPLGWTYTFFLLLFVFFVSGSIIMYVVLIRMRYPVKVIILQEVAPYGFIPYKNDRARLISVGDMGEQIYFLRRAKKYRAGFGRMIGNNKIAWGIGEDGFWYNITFGNLNKKLMEAGVFPVSVDMRFVNYGVRKAIQERYDKKDFFQKWGTTIVMSVFIFVILIQASGMWFIFDKMNEAIQSTNTGLEESRKFQIEFQKGQRDLLLAYDNVFSGGGSGLRPAE